MLSDDLVPPTDPTPPNRRQPQPTAWQRLRGHRAGDWIRNPIVIGVIGGLLVNLFWALGVFAYNTAEAKAEKFWQQYRTGLVEKAQHTSDPAALRALVQEIQQARPQ